MNYINVGQNSCLRGEKIFTLGTKRSLMYLSGMKNALLQMHVAVLLWGFTGVLGRAINLDAPVLVWYRMLLTAVIIAGIITARKLWVPVSRKDVLQLLRVGCIIGIHWVAFYGAIKFANATIALVCLSTASVFTSLLDPFVNKGKYDVIEVLLGLLALAGVYCIYQFQVFYGLGILFGVIAAILSSVFTVMNKKIANKYPSRIMVFYEMTGGWMFITLLMPLQWYFFPDTNFWPHTTTLLSAQWYQNDWLWLIVLSLCCTVWAQSLSLNALKKLSSFTVTLSVNLEPVYGMALAFLFYQENKGLNWGFFLGVGLILLSVILQMFRIMVPKYSGGFIKEKGGVE